MGGNGSAHGGPIAMDHVEHSRRYACGGDDLHKNASTQRGQLAGLEHHGAAGSQGRCQFAGHLIQGPVPRCNEAAHADGFALNARVAA